MPQVLFGAGEYVEVVEGIAVADEQIAVGSDGQAPYATRSTATPSPSPLRVLGGYAVLGTAVAITASALRLRRDQRLADALRNRMGTDIRIGSTLVP
ncbi:hypothetical protein [Streptomyces sp. NPDC050548]|uniref:hypothetical protein n=1 Tax=Streptomyces sp. NPDC050548 TaxID=3365629 RepID=UPI00378DFF0D